jgi:hypothetical protein
MDLVGEMSGARKTGCLRDYQAWLLHGRMIRSCPP